MSQSKHETSGTGNRVTESVSSKGNGQDGTRKMKSMQDIQKWPITTMVVVLSGDMQGGEGLSLEVQWG